MAKRLPTQVFIGAYHGYEVADDIQKMVTDAEWDSKQLIVTNAAVAKCDIAGKTTVHELGSSAAMEAAAEGAMLGGLLGSFSLLTLGTAGATKQLQDEQAGRKPRRQSTLMKVAAKQIEGMDKEKLASLGRALKPGTSAVILVFDEVIVKASDYESKNMAEEKETREAISDIVMSRIKEHLALGHDIAFHICLDENGMTATRTVTGKDATQVRDIVLGNDTVAVSEVITTSKGMATEAVTITPEAITTARTLLTSSIMAYELSAITGEGDDEEFTYLAGAETDGSSAYEAAKVNKDGATFESGYEAAAADDTGLSYLKGHEKLVITADTTEYQKETTTVDVTVETTTNKAIEE